MFFDLRRAFRVFGSCDARCSAFASICSNFFNRPSVDGISVDPMGFYHDFFAENSAYNPWITHMESPQKSVRCSHL